MSAIGTFPVWTTRNFQAPQRLPESATIDVKRRTGVQGAVPSSKAKRAVNLSIDAELLQLAKEMKANLSRVVEQALSDATAGERAKQFYEANKAFMDWHNELLERHGT